MLSLKGLETLNNNLLELVKLLVKFHGQDEVYKVNSAAYLNRGFFSEVLKFSEAVLPVLFFDLICTISFLFLDSSYRFINLSKGVMVFAPTENNRKVISRVLSSFLPDNELKFDKIDLFFLRLKGFFLVFTIVYNVSHVFRETDMPTRLQICRALAAYTFFRMQLKSVEVVVLANDHAPVPVALNYAAKNRNIKVVYCQHGPVTDLFPPLNFDLSILFNERSSKVYRNKRHYSSEGGREVVVSPYQEDFTTPRKLSSISSICISLGVSPNFEGVKYIISNIQGRGVQVALKLHPRTNPRARCTIDKIPGIKVINNFTVDTWNEFDLHLAGNSGVIVDALHFGVPTAYCKDLDDLSFDYYGFLSEKIVIEYDSKFLSDVREINLFYGMEWRGRFSEFDSTVIVPRREQISACDNHLKQLLRTID